MEPMPTDLPDTDKALVEAARRGEPWEAPDTPFPTPEELADEDFVRAMPAIRATTIRALCLGLWEGIEVDPKGVVICGARVDGPLDLSYGTAQRPLALYHCHLASRPNFLRSSLPALNLSGSRLEDGLQGDGIRITGSLLCREDFTAIGKVGLLGADVGGNLDFDGAHLDGRGNHALDTERASIKGHVLCRKGFTISGNADFNFAHVTGLFHWRPKNWTGRLDMSHARVGSWRDGWTGDGWGCAEGERTLVMTDFVYDGLAEGNDVRRDAPSRIAWIRKALGEDFRPGPYEVLASVLRREGDEDGAKAVMLAKHQDERRHRQRTTGGWKGASMWPRTAWGTLLDLTTGYGYRPWLGARLLLLFFAVGGGVFACSAPTTVGGSGIIKPSVPVTIMEDLGRHTLATGADGQAIRVPVDPDDPPPTHAVHYRLPTEYTPFNAFWYSLDTLIPLIDLGQERAWYPSPFGTLRDDPVGWAVLGYLYVHILLGWTLSTLTVVALTGLIKRDRE